jgi:DNA-directed RNA polymerase specialized sigma24 family protein
VEHIKDRSLLSAPPAGFVNTLPSGFDGEIVTSDPTPTFEDLYTTDYRPLVRLAFVMLGHHGPAEEVVQDSFAKVYERWATLDKPGGYLRTCVVNGCREVHRRRRLALWRRPSVVPGTSDLGADHMLSALACLTPKRRAAVVLRYYLDMPEAEIAETLDVRPGTVKSMLHRSLTQLREVIER